jgi:hypothetical protein
VDCSQPGPMRVAPGQGDGDPVPTKRCFVYRGGDVIDEVGDKVGTLNRGVSWFVCQAKTTRLNPEVLQRNGSTAYNQHWLLTLSDSKPREWGWFPATHISVGGNFNPVPHVPFCDATESIPGPLP